MNVEIVKATSEGETVLCKIECDGTKESWEAQVRPVMECLDARVKEMNIRYLDALKIVEHFPPDYRPAFKCAVDALYGKRPEQLTNLPWPNTAPVSERTGHA